MEVISSEEVSKLSDSEKSTNQNKHSKVTISNNKSKIPLRCCFENVKWDFNSIITLVINVWTYLLVRRQ